ncbi:MAG TPA: hypothetical protein VMU40_10585 [Steroidobacteraceae bacterium]|nr:hypothetical protein [Steroidobacteraceae bacterium]
MLDVREALAEVDTIRGQIARCLQFRGYGPVTVGTTGVLAFAVAGAQAVWAPRAEQLANAYLALWIATAAVALTLILIETLARARRIHSGFAPEMIRSALEQFLPPIVAGVLLTVVLLRCAPEALWMLPGLWQMLFSLGVFASCRLLPRAVFWVGVWYLATGMLCLALGHGAWAFSPWEMGVPFGVGQLLVAVSLQFGYQQTDA